MMGAVYVSWDLVDRVVTANGLDRVEVTGGTRASRIIEATGTDEVRAALEYVRGNCSGDVTVTAWKSSERKASAFVWTIDGGNASQKGIGNVQGANIGLLEQLYATKLEIAVMKHEQEHQDAGKYDRIVELAENLGPQLIAALVGRPVQPLARVVQPVASVPDGETLPDAELSAMLADVVQFAKARPAEARTYIAMLRNQLEVDGEQNDNG